MRPSIYFHIDEVARDAVVAANLRKILHPRGVEVVYGNRAHSELFGLFDNFSAFDLYLFPNVDLFQTTCPNPDRLSAAVIILPTETVGGMTRNVDRLAAKYFGSFPDECWPWINKVAAFCVWGPSHTKAFEAKGPHLLPKCHIVGHPRFDRRCQSEPKVAANTEKIRIGIISRFAGINAFDRRSILQVVYDARNVKGRELPSYRLSPNLNIEDRIYTESIDLRHLFDFIDRLDPQVYDVIVRTHPREDRTRWQTLIAQNRLPLQLAPWDQPFIHWVNTVDYVVGPVSTSFYDCITVGKMPICTIDIAPHRKDHALVGGDDDNPILNYVARPGSIEELLKRVAGKPEAGRLNRPEGLIHILRQEANYPDCSNSLDNVARVCEDVLKETRHKCKASLTGRVKHELFARAQGAVLQAARYGKPEQSSSFALSTKRRRWIDALAGATHRFLKNSV